MPFIDSSYSIDENCKTHHVYYNNILTAELIYNSFDNIQMVRDYLKIDRKLDIRKLYNVTDEQIIDNLSTNTNTSTNFDNEICNLYKSTTNCGKFTKDVYINSKYIRIKLTIKNGRILNKITTNNGRKGIPVQCDMSHLKTLRGHDIHLVTSIYSMLNRGSLSQLFEQRSFGGLATSLCDIEPVYDTRLNCQVGWCGRGLFRFCADNPIENVQFKSIRIDQLTDITFLNNLLSSTLHLIVSNTENGLTTPFGLMSDLMYRLFSNFHLYNRRITFPRLNSKTLRSMLMTYFFLLKNGATTLKLPGRST